MNGQPLPYTRHCFVCGAHNPHGLHLRFEREADTVTAEWVPAAHQAGFREIIHGGVITTVLDEAMFWAAACHTGRFGLAAELRVRFLKKVPLGQPLTVVATFQADRGRIWESRAEVRDAAGTVYARATCKQVPMSVAEARAAARDFLPDPATAEALGLLTQLG